MFLGPTVRWGAVFLLLIAAAALTGWLPWSTSTRAAPLAYASGFTFSPRQAQYLGVSWQDGFHAAATLRPELVRLGVYWDELEPRRGQFDFTGIDWLLSEAHSRDMRVVLTIGMKAPRWPEYYVPRWMARRLEAGRGDAVSRDPELRAAVLRAIEAVVRRYQDHPAIAAWQVENEPLDPAGPNHWVIDPEFLEREIALVRELDAHRRPIIVTMFVSGNPRLLLNPRDPRVENILRHADVLGLDFYPRVGVKLFGRELYLSWSNWLWQFALDRYAGAAEARGKTAWVMEAQAEPWEPESLIPAPRDVSPGLQARGAAAIATRLHAAGFDPILLWGVEYWYARKLLHNDDSWDTAWSLLGPDAE